MIRVVYLCGSDELSRVVYANLFGRCDIVSVVVERPVSKYFLFKRRVKRLGLFESVGQVLFILSNKFLAVFDRRRVNELRNRFVRRGEAYPVDRVHKVDSVNSDDVPRIIEKSSPDLVIVNGTRILSRALLSVIDCPIVNTHVGITPQYRGVHGGYWALRNHDRENFGVTVHLIDSGIDTGDVLYQKRLEPSSSDSINTYPYLQIEAALPLLHQVLSDVEDGRLKPLTDEGESRLFHHPTLWGYWFYRMFYGVK